MVNPQYEPNRADRVDAVGSFSDDSDVVLDGNQAGYVNSAVTVTTFPQFQAAGALVNGIAPVEVGDRWEFIDTSGKLMKSLSTTKRASPRLAYSLWTWEVIGG